ncbi:MAG TPA: hypothetical protein VFW85_03570 [Gaiellaceae bacterium]|nr:hypothetical protein [Gaiellaceae bacterium]
MNNALPTIVGTPRVDGSLSATPGTWTDAGAITFSYAWDECNPSGGACMTLPAYTTESISRLSAVVGQTVRVVVTATADDGTATATSAPELVQGAGSAPPPSGKPPTRTSASGLKVTFISPKANATVTTQAFKVHVRVTGTKAKARVRISAGNQTKTVTGSAPAVFSFKQGGYVQLEAVATSGSKSGRAVERIAHQPPITAVQGNGAIKPGCRICVVKDAHGDGSAPDLASAGATVSGAWVTFTVTAFDSIRNAGENQGHPGLVIYPQVNGRVHGLTVGSGGDRDVPAQISYPNVHTMRFRVRVSAFGKATALLWQVWALYPGDNLRDTLPFGTPSNDPRNCFIATQLVRQPPNAYEFGTNSCSQAGVVTAKP